jgi:hypothetical protein
MRRGKSNRMEEETMSRQQWGHGFWTGYARGQKAGLLTAVEPKLPRKASTRQDDRALTVDFSDGVKLVFHRIHSQREGEIIADVSGYYQGREVARMMQMNVKSAEELAAFQAMAEHNRLNGVDLSGAAYTAVVNLSDPTARLEYATKVSEITGAPMATVEAALERLVPKVEEALLMREAGK